MTGMAAGLSCEDWNPYGRTGQHIQVTAPTGPAACQQHRPRTPCITPRRGKFQPHGVVLREQDRGPGRPGPSGRQEEILAAGFQHQLQSVVPEAVGGPGIVAACLAYAWRDQAETALTVEDDIGVAGHLGHEVHRP